MPDITATIKHSNVPDGQGDSYRKGLVGGATSSPMKRYFAQGNNRYMRP